MLKEAESMLFNLMLIFMIVMAVIFSLKVVILFKLKAISFIKGSFMVIVIGVLITIGTSMISSESMIMSDTYMAVSMIGVFLVFSGIVLLLISCAIYYIKLVYESVKNREMSLKFRVVTILLLSLIVIIKISPYRYSNENMKMAYYNIDIPEAIEVKRMYTHDWKDGLTYDLLIYDDERKPNLSIDVINSDKSLMELKRVDSEEMIELLHSLQLDDERETVLNKLIDSIREDNNTESLFGKRSNRELYIIYDYGNNQLHLLRYKS